MSFRLVILIGAHISDLQGLGVADKLKINIEPGLFEWLAWYQDEMPSWMSASELIAAGYNIEPGYKPYISSEELHDTVQVRKIFAYIFKNI